VPACLPPRRGVAWRGMAEHAVLIAGERPTGLNVGGPGTTTDWAVAEPHRAHPGRLGRRAPVEAASTSRRYPPAWVRGR